MTGAPREIPISAEMRNLRDDALLSNGCFPRPRVGAPVFETNSIFSSFISGQRFQIFDQIAFLAIAKSQREARIVVVHDIKQGGETWKRPS